MNDNGERQHSLTVEMEAFDQLPPVLRQTLCEAAFRWSALSAQEEIRAGTPAPVIARMIRAADQRARGSLVP